MKASVSRLLIAVFTAAILVSCQQKPLTREEASELIRSSEAFNGPWDPQASVGDPQVRPGPNTRRELLSVKALAIKDGGPMGIFVGPTATAVFTWRWNGGPFDQRVFRSEARFDHSIGGKQWKVAEDVLLRELWTAERGGSE